MTSAGNEHGGLSGALWVPLWGIVRVRLSVDSGGEGSCRHCIRDSQRCPPFRHFRFKGLFVARLFILDFLFSMLSLLPPTRRLSPSPPPIRPHCRLSDPVLRLARDFIDGLTSAGCVLFVTLCVWSGVILQLFNNKNNNGYLERLNRTDLKRLHIL